MDKTTKLRLAEWWRKSNEPCPIDILALIEEFDRLTSAIEDLAESYDTHESVDFLGKDIAESLWGILKPEQPCKLK